MASIIGLTGGIASGKSTVATLLRERGAAVVDADRLARDVVQPGQPALAELVARFGADILRPDGTLDRPALAARAFADDDARRDLNRITHPRIAAAAQAAIAAHVRAGAPVVFYEAALLVENRLHEGLAGTIVVAVTPEAQAARLARRDGLDAAQIAARIAAQAPLADKLAIATWVVDNSGDRAALADEVERLWRRLEERFGPLTPPPRGEHVLVTGGADPLALALVRRLRASAPDLAIALVVAADAVAATAAALANLDVAILAGDVAAMHLGLSTREYRDLEAAITQVHHVAPACPQPSALTPYRTAVVDGTREVLELCATAPRLRRVVHWSPIDAVAGAAGRVAEAALPRPPSAPTAEARAAYQAEALATAAMARLPVTVLRVGHMVDGPIGERRTALALLRLVARRAPGVQLPLPGDGVGPLHLVDSGFVVAAAAILGDDPRAAGRILHLVDPEPPSVRAALDHVAIATGRTPLRGNLPRGVAQAILHTPGLARIATLPTALLALVSSRAHLATIETTALLAEAGVRCPPFATWIDGVVAPLATRPAAALDETDDPLA